MTTRLFIYGTLKKGQGRSSLLDGQKFLGEVKTEPHYRLYNNGAFPCLVEAEDGVSVEGGLWEVDDACFVRLDAIEGVAGGLFERRLVRLVGHEGVDAYLYLGSVKGLEDCEGRWEEVGFGHEDRCHHAQQYRMLQKYSWRRQPPCHAMMTKHHMFTAFVLCVLVSLGVWKFLRVPPRPLFHNVFTKNDRMLWREWMPDGVTTDYDDNLILADFERNMLVVVIGLSDRDSGYRYDSLHATEEKATITFERDPTPTVISISKAEHSFLLISKLGFTGREMHWYEQPGIGVVKPKVKRP